MGYSAPSWVGVGGIPADTRKVSPMAAKTISSFVRAFALVVGASAFLFVEAVFAQARPAASPRAVLRIKDMAKPGRACLVASPDIDGKVRSSGRVSRGKKWAMLDVQYETTPEWIDEVTFTFYILCQDAKTKEYHFFQTAVSYLDIEKGDHVAAAMLPPNAVKRYGEPISFGVEITIDGEKVASQAIGIGGDEWWAASLDKLGDRVKRHSGYLKDRSLTPFGVTHIDEYEAVR